MSFKNLVFTSSGFETVVLFQYALLLGFILLVKLVVVIMTLTLKEDTIRNYINIPVYKYTEDPEIQYEIDTLQAKVPIT